MPYALLISVVIASTALISDLLALLQAVFSDFFSFFIVNPKQAIFFLILFFVLQQIEGNLIYPHVVGKFCRTSIHLGAVSGDRRWKTYGNCGDVSVYSTGIGMLYLVPSAGI